MESYNNIIKNYLYKYFLPKNDEIILENSSGGRTILENFMSKDDIQIQRSNKEQTIMEFYIGYVLNKLNRKIPNFCTVSKLDIKNDIIYYNQHSNISLKSFLNTCSEIEFYSCILQIILALGKSQEKFRFNHNALTVDNIFINKKGDGTITYKFGSIVYELKTDSIAVITNFKNSRIQYEGFCVHYNKDPCEYSKSVDILQILKSCQQNFEKSNPVYNSVKWIFTYLEHSDEQVNTLNFIDFFKYHKNDIFQSIISVKQRTLTSFPPYKYDNYLSQSKIINNYIGIYKNTTNDYDNYLLNEYIAFLNNLEKSSGGVIESNSTSGGFFETNSASGGVFESNSHGNEIELISMYNTKLYIAKSFIIYLRIKNEGKYLPKLFEIKDNLHDTIDGIKIKSLGILYNTKNSCTPKETIYNLISFFPLMNELLIEINKC